MYMSRVIFQNQKFLKQFHTCNGIENYFNRKNCYPIIAVGIYFQPSLECSMPSSVQKIRSKAGQKIAYYF